MAANDDTCKHPIVKAINSRLAAEQEDGRRKHLGGSLIGRKCLRELWYSFRWATTKPLSGRMVRLFNRGHREEFRFVEWLRIIGVEVKEYSDDGMRLAYHAPIMEYIVVSRERLLELQEREGSNALIDVTDDPIEREIAKRCGHEVPQQTQWRISDIDGHFGGSLDGIIRFVPEITQWLNLPQDEPGLVEFKTHGLTSFTKLIAEGVAKAKPEHWAQMQIYMHKRGLKYAVYMAICKNTDRLHVEFVLPEFGAGEKFIEKAREVIYSKKPPNRLSTSPAWFECKFCDHRQKCHFNEALEKSCRTCVHAAPVSEGRWHCNQWSSLIPIEVEKEGCGFWNQIKD